jgi:hypothetical protein
MFIREMTETECLSILARTRLGRLACAHENQPYVVPIYFVYEEPYLYGLTTLDKRPEIQATMEDRLERPAPSRGCI